MDGDDPAVSASLADAFVARALPAIRAFVETEPAAETILREFLRLARSAHPKLEIAEDEFASFLGEHALEGGSLPETLAALHTADLLLTFACLRRDPIAMEEFRQLLSAEVARAARRVDADDASRDEVVQTLSASLLLEQGSPGLARYSGRGSLPGFLRVAAMRSLLRMKSRDRRSADLPAEGLASTVGHLRDPEIELIKVRYRDDFNNAFRTALDSLSHRERAVLRLHLVGNMSIDGIAACYRVHRSTVARWIADARKRLLEETEMVLMNSLSIPPGDVHSLARMLRSQLDPGLTTILRDTGRSQR